MAATLKHHRIPKLRRLRLPVKNQPRHDRAQEILQAWQTLCFANRYPTPRIIHEELEQVFKLWPDGNPG